ncbi:TIGR03364 family FAD-dependent oxidoreductase [Mycolicibacterium sp. HK-90]|uniref:TIGR03364 family FAD-dependent oxidoreductase n=1 Tax=Mycolicibacterium sp. HK-90 TaxID=3056937 RepID=UPI0026592F52|nr:TIGR03364 family FAD-dependent oxidoreductase [Mycolicibacterium sp. HK-90]WKG03229.1 TIGR03364 family FAD-dependent oxidoreductase [Mycolicibacterium sp. HK-90]
MGNHQSYDVVVVGAGIVGLAHAYHAHQRGLSVAVVEHADGVVGASVQNFGHACITAQSGVAGEYGRIGRQHWLDLSRKAGFWSAEAGTFCVARHDDELAVMREFAAARGSAEVRLLSRGEILDRIPVVPDNVTGGMYLPNDLQVDPRTAAPSIARWLAGEGVDFHWRTAASGFEPGVVRTSRGPLRARTTFVTVNYDIDRLFPGLAERDGLLRCRLHMLRARLPLSFALPAPLFTGWSLLRYSGFENLPATAAVAERLRAEHPDYVAIDLHQMYTPQPDGSLLIGDTHYRDISAPPFQTEEGFAVLLEEARKLFGVKEIEVSERWQGVYTSAPGKEFLIEQPIEGTHVVTVTTGIGMTTSMGLAYTSVENALARVAAPA